MKNILFAFQNMSLKRKLILSFIGFIVVPLIVLNIFLTNIYSDEIQNTVIKSSIQSNEQGIKNLDTFLGILSKLSEYPTTAPTVAPAEKPKEVTIGFGMWGSEEEIKVQKENALGIEKLYPGMKIEVVAYPDSATFW